MCDGCSPSHKSALILKFLLCDNTKGHSAVFECLRKSIGGACKDTACLNTAKVLVLIALRKASAYRNALVLMRHTRIC